jgi:hypothetical protein
MTLPASYFVDRPENRVKLASIIKKSSKQKVITMVKMFLKTKQPSYKLEVFETEIIKLINSVCANELEGVE